MPDTDDADAIARAELPAHHASSPFSCGAFLGAYSGALQIFLDLLELLFGQKDAIAFAQTGGPAAEVLDPVDGSVTHPHFRLRLHLNSPKA